MRTLTPQEIEHFASRPGVKRIAVENFLMSMGTDTTNAFNNLALDSKLYKWNVATFEAIEASIYLAARTIG